MECLIVEVVDDRAFLQESSEITFNDKNMKMRYLDHRRPPLLSNIYKSNPHQESLGGYECFCKPHPTKYFTSSGNLRKEDSGMPNGSDKVWWKRRIHRRSHPAVVEGGPHSLFSLLPCGENRSLISCASGEAMVAQAPISHIHLSSMCKRKVE